MAYYWVNQGKTYNSERIGGFLWAPITNSQGNNIFHWTNVKLVNAGDVIFCYANKYLKSICIANANAFESAKPDDLGNDWMREGTQVNVSYIDLPKPVPFDKIPKYSWQDHGAPITKDGKRVNQGYLFKVPNSIGEDLIRKYYPSLSHIVKENEDLQNQEEIQNEEDTSNKITGKNTIILARVGQGKFRTNLLKLWKGKCAVTGLELKDLLTASHAKPWAISSNQEKLSQYNGLLLSPSYNALYDKFLISFTPDGNLKYCDNILNNKMLEQLGISPGVKISGLLPQHKPFLEFHLSEMEKKNQLAKKNK